MKLFVAGIDFQALCLKPNVDHHKDKTDHIIKLIPEIVKDAAALGEDTMIVIVLSEYAPTGDVAITTTEKNACLVQLQASLQPFNNVLLIPGSFSAHKQFNAYSTHEEQLKKLEKIRQNYYTSHTNNVRYCKDLQFKMAVSNTMKAFSNPNLAEMTSLQNSTYLITSGSRCKHKKSIPWEEEKKLKTRARNSVFNAGGDDPVKEVLINGKKVKVVVSICLEHVYLTSESPQIKNNLPLFQIIISDPVNILQKNLIGAVNIQMDSISALSVYINDAHEYSGVIKEVQAVCYYPKDNKGSVHKNPTPVVHFSNPIGALPSVSSNDNRV